MQSWLGGKLVRYLMRNLNAGNIKPTTALDAPDVELTFPGDNSWADEFRPFERGRQAHVTHRGTAEMARFLQRYVAAGIQMEVEDVLVNGPPWNMRAAVRVHVWSPGEPGDRYTNRAVLFVTATWGKLRTQEDYEDTQRAAAFDALLNRPEPVSEPF